MRFKLPIKDADDVCILLNAAGHVRKLCSISNGGLPKWEKRWAAMPDEDKRLFLMYACHISEILLSLGRAKVEVEAEVTGSSK